MQKYFLFFVFCILFPFVALAADEEISDPLEPVNRGVFWFNNQFENYLADPVAEGYDAVTPDDVQTGVRNFFRNLGFPVRFVSNVIKLDFKQAGKETVRFVVNTTVGVAGLMDVAGECESLKHTPVDFGSALAHYGVPEGPYLVLPIIGPSNVRDTGSLVVDVLLNPLFWLTSGNTFDSGTDQAIDIGASSLLYVNTRARYLEVLQDLKENSIDYYLAQQSHYLQYRRGEVGVDQFSDDENWYEDEFDDDLEDEHAQPENSNEDGLAQDDVEQ